MDRVRQEKVQRFEEFVDRRLKPDLVKAIAQRDEVFEEHKTFPDTSRIFVDVGLGFHVKFTWSEAPKNISMREEKLAKEVEDGSLSIASIKAYIKLVLEGIRELFNLPD